MNVITVVLKQDIKGLGRKGEIVKVKEGYARNYLIRNGIAEKVDESSKKAIENEKKIQLEKLGRKEEDARALKKELEENYIMVIYERAGREGKLFGAVTPEIIAEKLKKDKNIEIDKRRIIIDDPIKSVGVHNVEVKLYTNVTAKLKVNVKEVTS
jgi:large subunit ribosomal protein L9